MLHDIAYAKVNLCLHITGQRDDGMHLLDSVVVFPEIGDLLTAEISEELSLVVSGPFGAGLVGDNLILQAARLMGVTAKLHLTKNLPIASGIGGGSADGAASIRLLSELTASPRPSLHELSALSADIPVCLLQKPTRMQGIGETLSPLPALPTFWIVLVNAGQEVNTGQVFRKMTKRDHPPMTIPAGFLNFESFITFLSRQRNDMQSAAIATCPIITEVLAAIESTQDCAFVRMSGSGGTCFGLYETEAAATTAATQIQADHPEWWAVSAKV